ncbi:MAG: hypothetical protein HOK11_01415 [Rhodospirillaceae bacterium]|jgi:TPR repeat protein|nr:hypothetical protein [Rhodospirillaceae bacterium]
MCFLRRLFGPFLLLLAFNLSGCAGVALEGANIARDKVIVSQNRDAARAGDAEAQYKVGKALCCSVNEGEGFYNTPVAVSWLCRAAAQNYAPAANMLGKIYSGDVVSGVRVLRRVAQKFAGTSIEQSVAYSWFRRAERQGVADAKKTATAIWSDLTDEERASASSMVTGQKPIPCEWSEVFRQPS